MESGVAMILPIYRVCDLNHLEMCFYTTAEQEAELDLEYKRQLTRKQTELDEVEKRTGKLQKFTAYGHIHKPDRVFYVRNGNVFYGDKEMPSERVPGGGVYTFDTYFSKQIAEFCRKHATYKVVFKPHGKYGPCVGYIGSPGSMPAHLIADTEELVADNDDAYDLLCC